jgi:hypothetical protein
MIGHTVTEETRAKISKKLSGEGNFNYGKPRSEETKKKLSRPVILIKETGEEIWFPSIVALRVETGMTPTSVNRSLKSDNFMSCHYARLKIRYADKEPQ